MDQEPAIPSSLRIRFTHCVHPLSVEGHHCVGRVAHEHTLVVDVVRGALDGHHGLGGQAEVVCLQCLTTRHTKTYTQKNRTQYKLMETFRMDSLG